MKFPRNRLAWEPKELLLIEAYSKIEDGFERLSRRLGRSVKAIQLKADDLDIQRSVASTNAGIGRLDLETEKDRILEGWERNRSHRFVSEAKEAGYWAE